MSITIQQIADLFGDQDQDPSTPIFSGHKYEELQLQNLQLRQQVELLQSELKYQCGNQFFQHIAFSQNMCQSVIRLKNLLKHEMQKNKTLTDEYVKKSEEQWMFQRGTLGLDYLHVHQNVQQQQIQQC
ncbi:hypothetical protein pb186bvf_019437 [Paramecium bursaria]